MVVYRIIVNEMTDQLVFDSIHSNDQQINEYLASSSLIQSNNTTNQPPNKYIKLNHNNNHDDDDNDNKSAQHKLLPFQPIIQYIADTASIPPHTTFQCIKQLLILYIQYNIALYDINDGNDPLIDGDTYEQRIDQLIDTVNEYTVPPFTLQRFSELLIEPMQQYANLHKYITALSKCIIGVSGDQLSAELIQVSDDEENENNDGTSVKPGDNAKKLHSNGTDNHDLLHNVSNGISIHTSNTNK